MSESGSYQVSGSGVVTTATGGYDIISGCSLAETAGTAILVEIRDGPSATGHIVAAVQLAARGSTPFAVLPNVKCNGGVYVNVVGAGTLEGAVYIQ